MKGACESSSWLQKQRQKQRALQFLFQNQELFLWIHELRTLGKSYVQIAEMLPSFEEGKRLHASSLYRIYQRYLSLLGIEEADATSLPLSTQELEKRMEAWGLPPSLQAPRPQAQRRKYVHWSTAVPRMNSGRLLLGPFAQHLQNALFEVHLLHWIAFEALLEFLQKHQNTFLAAVCVSPYLHFESYFLAQAQQEIFPSESFFLPEEVLALQLTHLFHQYAWKDAFAVAHELIEQFYQNLQKFIFQHYLPLFLSPSAYSFPSEP